MRGSRTAAVLIGLALGVTIVTGCAGQAPAETPAASAPVSTPEPTVEPIVIGPAEMPPVPFDGDCERMLSAEDLSETLGKNVVFEWSGAGGTGANIGALHCSWQVGEFDSMSATVIPRAGLDGATLSPDRVESYFADCESHVCSWQGGDDDVWVGFDYLAMGLDRDVVDGWSSSLGERILTGVEESAAEPWVRDRTGWWPVLACAQIAQAVGDQLGEAVTGQEGGWEDLPSPWYVLAHQASRGTICSLQVGDTYVSFSALAGTGTEGWDTPLNWTAVELGIPGIDAFVSDQQYSADYSFTDGINGILVQMHGDEGAGPSPQDIAVAVAAAAASDFQP